MRGSTPGHIQVSVCSLSRRMHVHDPKTVRRTWVINSNEEASRIRDRLEHPGALERHYRYCGAYTERRLLRREPGPLGPMMQIVVVDR